MLETTPEVHSELDPEVPEADLVRMYGVKDARYGEAEVWSYDGERYFIDGESVFVITVDTDEVNVGS
jgi:hypothetical protein